MDNCPGDELSEPLWDTLTEYVRQIADLLELRDWRFRIQREPPEDGDCIASLQTIDGRKVAALRVRGDFWDQSGEESRHTITHELIHCHHAAAQDIIRLDTSKHLGQATYDVLHGAFSRQMEYAVDGLADALAPHLPLPPWGEKADLPE